MEVDSGDMPIYGNLLDSQINLIAQWIDAGACENSDDVLDECGACVSTNDTSCIQGCDGNYANDGTHLVR